VPQDKPAVENKDGVLTITPNPQGWGVLELFSSIHRVTGRSILYDEGTNPKIKTAKVQFVGTHIVRERDLFSWLQAVLSFNNLVLVPVGPTSPDGKQQWFCLDQNNAAVKTKPVYIDEKDIYEFEDRDGLYVVTSLQLRYISDTARVRQALTALTSTAAGGGRIQDVPGSRSIIVGDFAPVVAAMKRLVEYIDKENVNIEPQMEVVYLKHAVASELGPLVQDLIESSDAAQRQPRQPGQVEEDPAPKIIPDDRLDALILYATEKYMSKIKVLIEKLDVESRARGRIHFRALKHTDAEEMANLLEDLLEGISSGGTGGGGGRSTSSYRRTTSRSNTPAPTPAGGGGALTSSASEGKPVIIPDKKSNSLIIQSSPSQIGQLDELLAKLDTSRPQVLIETALVQLSVTDSLLLGVELFSSQNDIAIDTDGDGQADSITQDRKGFGGSQFGLTTPVTTDVNGNSLTTGFFPAFGTGVTAGIFNNGKLAGILQALQTRGTTKFLTRPSVVANDNEAAEILVSDETSYRENVTADNGQTRDSFQTVTADNMLRISPSISSESFLRLGIEQKVSNFEPSSSGIVGAPPDKKERTITTNVTIPDQWTVVLGGYITEAQTSQVSKVPILGDLPLLGFLFRKTEDRSVPSQLFLFVTPRILRDMDGFSEYHQVTWERKLLQDDLFGKPFQMNGTKFAGPRTAPASAAERLDELERSGALDGARLKAPLSDEERRKIAEEELRARQKAEREAEKKDGEKKDDGAKDK
jgi:type II secretion system protein D